MHGWAWRFRFLSQVALRTFVRMGICVRARHFTLSDFAHSDGGCKRGARLPLFAYMRMFRSREYLIKMFKYGWRQSCLSACVVLCRNMRSTDQLATRISSLRLQLRQHSDTIYRSFRPIKQDLRYCNAPDHRTQATDPRLDIARTETAYGSYLNPLSQRAWVRHKRRNRTLEAPADLLSPHVRRQCRNDYCHDEYCILERTTLDLNAGPRTFRMSSGMNSPEHRNCLKLHVRVKTV